MCLMCSDIYNSDMVELLYAYMKESIINQIKTIMADTGYTGHSDIVQCFGNEDGKWIHQSFFNDNEHISVNIGFDDEHYYFCEFNVYDKWGLSKQKEPIFIEETDLNKWVYFSNKVLQAALCLSN